MMRKWHGLVFIVLALLALFGGQAGLAGAESDAPAFKDIETHWAKTVIQQAVQKGYVTGYADGSFKPNQPVTVAEFLAMLFLSFTERDSSGQITWSQATLERMPEPHRHTWIDGYAYDFSQGKPWYKNYADYAQFFGLIKDEYEGRYSEALTRERAARIVTRADSLFHPVITDEYAALAIAKMKDYKYIEEHLRWDAAKTLIAGILSGYPDSKWKPKQAITRAEAISVIERINNDSLRQPTKVDLSNVPYSEVPTFGSNEKQIIVFANWEMKKVHDELAMLMSDYSGKAEMYYGQFGYFANEDLKSQFNQKKYYGHTFDREILYDVILGATGNSYNFVFSIEAGRYERAIEPLNQALKMIFKDNAGNVEKPISEAMGQLQNGKEVSVNKMIENRQILIFGKIGEKTMSVGISGYADK
jgi:hypothetical protein